jgi:low density lipoprotein receptor adapter protein 1
LNDDDELTDDIVTYNLKYLGSTLLTKSVEETKTKIKFTSKKSSLATTSAIKKIIVASKSQKKLSEVTISISPKGIEAYDIATDERLIEIPIYKISYCSVDAAHDTIFSFVSSSAESSEENNFQNNQFGSPESPAGQLESTSIEDEGDLVLHAFQCNKRKIAHTVTMSVARAFERAFQIYQNEQLLKDAKNKKTNKENIQEAEKNAVNIKNLIAGSGGDEKLIDLDDAPQLNYLYSKESNREYLQTTWVSFD